MNRLYIAVITLTLLILMFSLSSCSNTSWTHFTDEEPEYDYSEYEDQDRGYDDQEEAAEAHDAEYAYNLMWEEHPDGMYWSDVENHAGEYVYCFGKVMDVDSESSSGDPTFVDVGGMYPDKRVTGIIWPEYSTVFSDIHDIEGEYICINGTVYMYDGIPNIELTDASQIEVFGY